MLHLQFPCLNIADLGKEVIEGEISHQDFDQLHFAIFSYVITYRQEPKRDAPVTIVVDSVATGDNFTFRVRSGSGM